MAGLTDKQILALPQHVQGHIKGLRAEIERLHNEKREIIRDRDTAEAQVRSLTISVNRLRNENHELHNK